MTANKKNNFRAGIITIFVHLLLILGFVLLRFSVPANTSATEDYLEVDLGTDEDGFGTQQPEDMDGPAPEESANQTSNTSSSNNQIVSHDDDVNATPVNIPKKTNNTPRKNSANSTTSATANSRTTANTNRSSNNSSTTSTVRNPRYTYPGGQGEGGNSASRNNAGGSQGDGSGSGDKGTPGGVVGGRYISAIPNLRGRSLRTRPDPNATFNEGGKVVVRVTVNREGTILKYSFVSAANSTLKQIVEQKIKSVTFTKSSTAPPEQTGTITFNFKTSK